MYSVNYTTPLTGYFGEYPTSGEIEITNLENSDDGLSIEAAPLGSSKHFHLIDATQQSIGLSAADWNGRATYRLSKINSMVVKTHQENEIRLLGAIATKADFENTDSFSFILTRPITTSNGDVNFYQNTPFGHRTTGTLEIVGTTVIVTPNEPLQAGATYDINLPTVTSQTGISASDLSFTVQISDSIVPVITASQGYFTRLSLPTLSAAKSQLNDGREFQYSWQVAGGLNVIFEHATQVETVVDISPDVRQNVEVKLTMTNELGHRAVAEKTLRYLDINAPYMLIVGTSESYIAQGETWPLNDKDGEFSLSTQAYYTVEKPRSFVSVAYQGANSWDLTISAPKGEILAVGKYQGATRYPFQEDDVAGLDFGGQDRRCNSSISDFEIYEITFDTDNKLTTLAMDFDLACEQATRERLKGVVRINTDYPFSVK
ncbi:MAG: hypothetical protein HRU25_16995 [Psychrobium sp.]|nr:hypothetical protein [Psychrobium sp.]